jgi:hypothetical protein
MQLFDITHVCDDCELANTAFYDYYTYIMTYSEAISDWYQYLLQAKSSAYLSKDLLYRKVFHTVNGLLSSHLNPGIQVN